MPSDLPADLRALKHVPVLDGFRGIAVLVVVAMHNFRMPLGWAGVDLFFVLSGFLITRILLNTKECPGYLKTFYARRFLRIFPIYYLTLFAVWLVHAKAEGKMWWYAAYLSDFGWLAPSLYVGPLIHTWSLAIEEQFYLIWPWLVGWLSRQRLMQLCVALLCSNLAVRVYLSLANGSEGFYCYSIFTRSDGIMAGALLALLIQGGMIHSATNRRVTLSILGVSVLALVGLAASRNLSLSGMSVPMSVLGLPSIVAASAAAIWWAMGIPSSSRLYGLLTWRPLSFTGRISYGLYLYHLPVTYLCKDKLALPKTILGQLAEGVILTVIAFALALASWHLIEAPLNGLKRFWEYRRQSGEVSRSSAG